MMVYRSRPILLIAGLLSFTWLGPASAQRGSGRSPLPAVGTMLPEVTAYDDQGNEFSTASLRGSYTVLVFGCLT